MRKLRSGGVKERTHIDIARTFTRVFYMKFLVHQNEHEEARKDYTGDTSYPLPNFFNL